MDDQVFKNQYVLERMTVWLINPLELNFSWFHLSEITILEKHFRSPTPKKGTTVQIYPLEKNTLHPWKKIVFKVYSGTLSPYPCTGKK